MNQIMFSIPNKFQPYEIKEKDIQSQEERVLLQRRRLQEARKLLGS